MTAEIITFDENSVKCVICKPIDTIACHMAPYGKVTFEQEMKQNPGIELETPTWVGGGFSENIKSFYSIYVDNVFTPHYMGIHVADSFILCPTK